MLHTDPRTTGGHPGDNNRPPLAAAATSQPVTAPTRPDPENRCRVAVSNAPTAATASAIPDPAGPGGATSTPVAMANPVKNTRAASARAANRRNHSRTVPGGTPNNTATDRCPNPRAAFAANAAPITATEYARRSRQNTGNNTCVARHPAHRDRRGRTRSPPPSPRTDRTRACPHGASRPPHRGHPSAPDSKWDSTTAALAATVNTGASVRHRTALPRRVCQDPQAREGRSPIRCSAH